MEFLRDICQGDGCGRLSMIINKKYYLCDDCNYKRLHGGKSKEEVYKLRHEQNRKVMQPVTAKVPSKEALVEGLKKTFTIKKISNKRAQRHAAVKETYKRIDNSRERICEGCGKNLPLSHSHILSEQQRPDLYATEQNIRLHCFGSYGNCHEKWERGLIYEVVEMLDFKENLEFIKEVDKGEYNKIIANAEFHGVKIAA